MSFRPNKLSGNPSPHHELMPELPDVEKPTLLKAIEIVLAKPENIRQEAQQLVAQIAKANPTKSPRQVQKLAATRIIRNYSYFAAFSGGLTGLSGAVPGIGTAVAMTAGASADVVAIMKFQIEMTMALATVYGHDILIEEEKRLCYLIAGLGAVGETAKTAGKTAGSKAFIRLVREHLKGETLTILKELFAKIGITFTRSALEKAIPFLVGSIIGATANKGLTWYVGTKARDFFEVESEDGGNPPAEQGAQTT